MFIDIHAHFQEPKGFPRNLEGDTFATPDELIKTYKEYNITKGCILPLVSPEARYVIQNTDWIIERCNNSNGKFIPFCNIDPRQLSNSPKSNLRLMLMYYKDKGAKALGEITANLPFTNKFMQNLFKACENEQLPVTFHIGPTIGKTYGVFDEVGLPLLEKTLKKYKDLIFLGHSQAFWAEIGQIKNNSLRKKYPKGKIKKPGRVVELMRKYPNLHGDLSANSGLNAIARDKEFGIKFLNEFADRLYFGTDICSPKTKPMLVNYLKQLRGEGAISTEVFEKIAYRNAEKLLNL